LANKDRAAEAFQAALDIKPDDFPTLHNLLDLYTAGKRWDEAIAILDRFVEVESDPVRRSRFNYTAAVLLRDEMGLQDESIDRFNTVLDDDPSMLKSFQAIDTLLTKAKDWKALERSYRKMLKRLPQEGFEQLKVTLWNNLAEIYRSRLRDYKAAAAALEVAAKLDPGNIARHVMMAELFDRLMEVEPRTYVESAVREHQILIANAPDRYESYHALFNIYAAADEVDKAFCVAACLTFLKQATVDEENFANRYRRTEMVRARQRLSEQVLRRHVLHPDEDQYLTAILGTIARAVAHWRANDPPSTLKSDESVDISVDPSLFSRTAKYVRDVLNVEMPDVYLRPSEPGDITLMNLKRDGRPQPTMVVFQNTLNWRKEAYFAFAFGRYMMDLYLPHYCYIALDRSPQALKQIFMACLRALGMPVQRNAAELDQIAREITLRMDGTQKSDLQTLMRKFQEAGGSTDVKRWAAASELTAYRVGLLLCQDLRIAAQIISQEQSILGSTMSPREKVKELVLYSISEDYFAARKALGIGVA
jgi:hypothetical protein